MTWVKKAMTLYAVTDRSWTQTISLPEQVKEALKGGITCLQLREKELDDTLFLEEAKIIRQLCTSYHVPFIINDNVKIALESKADGVHIGQSDMAADTVRDMIGKDMILGVSVQTAAQALLAQSQGADYLGVGAIFSTTTKQDADNVSYETLKRICECVHIPVVAIGGLTQDNMIQLKGSGIDGVALVSAIFSASNIENTCKQLYTLSKEVTHA